MPDNGGGGLEVMIRVRYQETDQMGIAHHASYWGWLEVARTELMRARGMPYRDAERAGVFLPVVACECRYRRPLRYDDEVTITVTSRSRGARLEFGYRLVGADKKTAAEAVTRHAWADRQGKAKNPSRHQPQIWSLLTGCPPGIDDHFTA